MPKHDIAIVLSSHRVVADAACVGAGAGSIQRETMSTQSHGLTHYPAPPRFSQVSMIANRDAYDSYFGCSYCATAARASIECKSVTRPFICIPGL